MDAAVSCCQRYLERKSLKFLQEWLEACVEWITEENNGLPSSDELPDLVYEQWLMADLREIAVPAFPDAIAERKGHSTLQGKFAVQVNMIMDIGHSAYSQLQKLKGEEIEEIDHDSNEEDNPKEFFNKAASDFEKNKKKSTRKNSKESSSRMLFMELHDGAQSVEAVEYQPMKDISTENVMPGGKVLITGPIKCFDGVLFLKHENIQLLGGNSEHLVEENSLVKVLCRTLNIEYNEKDFKKGSQQMMRPEQPVSADVKSSSVKENNPVAPRNMTDGNQKKSNKTDKRTSVIHTGSSSKKTKTDKVSNVPGKSAANFIDEDLFMDDDLFEDDEFEDFDNWDLKPQSKPLTKSHTTKSNISLSSTISLGKSSKNTSTYNPLLKKGNAETFSDEVRENKNQKRNILEENDNDDFFQEPCSSKNPFDNKQKSINRARQNVVGEKMNDQNVPSNFKKNKSSSLFGVSADKNHVQKFTDDCLIPESDFSEFDMEDPKTNMKINTNNEPVVELNLVEVIAYDEPIQYVFSLKGWIKTFVSKLSYNDRYRLMVVVTDETCKYVQMLLGDEALAALIGFEAQETYTAAMGHANEHKKLKVKKALQNAERLLEKCQWVMNIKFDKEENIYKVISLISNGTAKR